MPITLLAASSAVGGTVSSFDSTGAKLLLVSGSAINSGLTLTDNKSNTWLKIIEGTGASHWLYLWACMNPSSVGTGHSFTMGGTYSNIHVAAFDSDVGFEASTIAYGASTTGIASFSDPRLFITNMSYDTASVPTIDSGFTVSTYRAYGGGVNLGGGLGYKIQSSAGAEAPIWSDSRVCGLAAFRLAGGGGGGAASANRGLLVGGRR